MRRTELQAEVIRVLKAVAVLPDPSRRAPVAGRMLAKGLNIPSLQRKAFAEQFEARLRDCYRAGIMLEDDVSGVLADWIQDVTS